MQTTIVDVLSRTKSYRPYSGPKACGGYHADFAVRLESGGESAWFLVCLGCGEVLIYSKDGELICELDREAERRIEEAWKDHHEMPFVSFGSRLPITEAATREWGFSSYGAGNARPVEGREAGMPWKAYARKQTLFAKPAKGESVHFSATFSLTEETHATAEHAERRLNQLHEEVEHATRHARKPLRQSFAFRKRKQVYWITGDEDASLEEMQRLLDLLGRYCEETSPHDVRHYE